MIRNAIRKILIRMILGIENHQAVTLNEMLSWSLLFLLPLIRIPPKNQQLEKAV